MELLLNPNHQKKVIPASAGAGRMRGGALGAK
jgi:hypothetical protein